MFSTQSLASFPRPSVAACAFAGLAVLLGGTIAYDLYVNKRKSEAARSGRLHRSGAIRRRRDTSNIPSSDSRVDQGQQTDGDLDHPLASAHEPSTQRHNGEGHIEGRELEQGEVDVSSEDGETNNSIPNGGVEHLEDPERGSKLKQLTFLIAEKNSTNLGIVHRGISCDACGKRPIQGVRYRCANCEDFDLCETCEATNEHVRTHVFFKMRVPCYWGPGKSSPTWFPGMPRDMPKDLPNEVLDTVRRSLAFLDTRDMPSDYVIKGLYEQFTCLADRRFPPDKRSHGQGIEYGISTTAFRYLMPVSTRGALALNRLFCIFDDDQDGLISFQEFVHGVVLVNLRRAFPGWRDRLFKALDLNDDGYVGRRDLIQMYQSIHEVVEDITLCHLRLYNDSEDQRHLEERRSLRDWVHRSGSLPNYFTSSAYDQLHHHRLEAPVFGQLDGQSRLPSDDPGGHLLMSGYPDDERLVHSPPKTAAGTYIAVKLLCAFNDMLYPIFHDAECGASRLSFGKSFRKRHAELLYDLRETKLKLQGPTAPDDMALLQRDWDWISKHLGLDDETTALILVQTRYNTQKLLDQFCNDVLDIVTKVITSSGFSPSGITMDAYFRQEASSVNPCLRHNTLRVRPELVLQVLSLMLRDSMYEMIHGEHTPEHKAELSSKEFWSNIQDAEKAAEELGPELYTGPLPLVDVLGLIVV